MRKYILIGIGGFLGANLRFVVKSIHILSYRGNFPLNILIINVAGCFLLAFILTAAQGMRRLSTDIKNGITIGFLGAFTTFSTLCKDTIGLFNNGDYDTAILNIALSAVLGLGAAYVGTILACKLKTRIIKPSDY